MHPRCCVLLSLILIGGADFRPVCGQTDEKNVPTLYELLFVPDYKKAMTQFRGELLPLLEKNSALIVWCFGESNSLKDDQAEIRKHIELLFDQEMKTDSANHKLLHTVVSYGNRFHLLTKKPTGDLNKVQQAISAIPVDKTGVERMSQAVFRSIQTYHKQAAVEKRQLILVLATDESGDRQENEQYLEMVVKKAKELNCQIFVFGREAVFGSPHAYFHWKHPVSKQEHWIRIDRGPETAYVQQLQTTGFRTPAYNVPSGFGPFAQSRLVQETNGRFFALPSVERNQQHKHRYKQNVMRPFRPDLRSRKEITVAREKSKLRLVMWNVIQRLDPKNPRAVNIAPLRTEFKDGNQMQASLMATEKNEDLIQDAAQLLATLKDDRQAEPSLRWRANYDLIVAEVAAYLARTIEYRAALKQFVDNPKTVPQTRDNLPFHSWNVISGKDSVAGESNKAQIELAEKLLKSVMKDYAGTPWAVRADLECRQGFGVNLRPHYARKPIKLRPQPKPPKI